MSSVRSKPRTPPRRGQLELEARAMEAARDVDEIEVRRLGRGGGGHDEARAQERRSKALPLYVTSIDASRFARRAGRAWAPPRPGGGRVRSTTRCSFVEPGEPDEKRDGPRAALKPGRLGIEVERAARIDLRQRRIEREEREHPARGRSSRLNTGASDPVSHREALGSHVERAAPSLDESEGEFTRYGRRHQPIRWRCLRQNTGDAHAKSLELLTRIARSSANDACVATSSRLDFACDPALSGVGRGSPELGNRTRSSLDSQ